jgi:hypothetical protein
VNTVMKLGFRKMWVISLLPVRTIIFSRWTLLHGVSWLVTFTTCLKLSHISCPVHEDHDLTLYDEVNSEYRSQTPQISAINNQATFELEIASSLMF